eukprot:CAMPEP_0115670190 /NCGR_PEP_ID=MMETSP0272-20121206/51393_1 /TAXON_ID=71861 /ORGANISM="Scrippsiella trochoidea, Strain CCMP3099" /LENGTH=177 /DNA_ID=CAMNT_0003108891 /DNA_START=233 /DNA_END=766 /DNA_ORIENTATION=-
MAVELAARKLPLVDTAVYQVCLPWPSLWSSFHLPVYCSDAEVQTPLPCRLPSRNWPLYIEPSSYVSSESMQSSPGKFLHIEEHSPMAAATVESATAFVWTPKVHVEATARRIGISLWIMHWPCTDDVIPRTAVLLTARQRTCVAPAAEGRAPKQPGIPASAGGPPSSSGHATLGRAH